MHTSREPQDDGYTLIPTSEKAVLEMNESDLSLTFDSSSDALQRTKTQKKVKSKVPISFKNNTLFALMNRIII